MAIAHTMVDFHTACDAQWLNALLAKAGIDLGGTVEVNAWEVHLSILEEALIALCTHHELIMCGLTSRISAVAASKAVGPSTAYLNAGNIVLALLHHVSRLDGSLGRHLAAVTGIPISAQTPRVFAEAVLTTLDVLA